MRDIPQTHVVDTQIPEEKKRKRNTNWTRPTHTSLELLIRTPVGMSPGCLNSPTFNLTVIFLRQLTFFFQTSLPCQILPNLLHKLIVLSEIDPEASDSVPFPSERLSWKWPSSWAPASGFTFPRWLLSNPAYFLKGNFDLCLSWLSLFILSFLNSF